MAKKPSNSDQPMVPPAVQWFALAGLAVLVVVAIFAFGIGGASVGGNGGVRGGHNNTIVVSSWF